MVEIALASTIPAPFTDYYDNILTGALLPTAGFCSEQHIIFPTGHSLSFGSEKDMILAKILNLACEIFTQKDTYIFNTAQCICSFLVASFISLFVLLLLVLVCFFPYKKNNYIFMDYFNPSRLWSCLCKTLFECALEYRFSEKSCQFFFPLRR